MKYQSNIDFQLNTDDYKEIARFVQIYIKWDMVKEVKSIILDEINFTEKVIKAIDGYLDGYVFHNHINQIIQNIVKERLEEKDFKWHLKDVLNSVLSEKMENYTLELKEEVEE